MKPKPFENDKDLKKVLNQLSSYGSQLAGWITTPKVVMNPFRVKVVEAVKRGK